MVIIWADVIGPGIFPRGRVNATISFEEAVFGTEREITFDRLEICETCDGIGAKPGTEASSCQQCNGSGEIRQVQQTFLGSMVRTSPCPNYVPR